MKNRCLGIGMGRHQSSYRGWCCRESEQLVRKGFSSRVVMHRASDPYSDVDNRVESASVDRPLIASIAGTELQNNQRLTGDTVTVEDGCDNVLRSNENAVLRDEEACPDEMKMLGRLLSQDREHYLVGFDYNTVAGLREVQAFRSFAN